MSLSPTRYVLCCMLPSVDGLTGLDQMDVKGFLKQLSREAPITMRLTLVLGVWALFNVFLTVKSHCHPFCFRADFKTSIRIESPTPVSIYCDNSYSQSKPSPACAGVSTLK